MAIPVGDVPIEVERDAGGDPARIQLTAPRAAWSCGVPFACIALRDAVAGLLGGITGPGEHGWVIDQGVELGRPSRLELRYTATAAGVEQVRLRGRAVALGGGSLRAPLPAEPS